MDSTDLSPSLPGAAARARFCTSCGAPSGGGRFCGGCGAPQDAAAQPVVPAQPAEAPHVDDPETVADTVVLQPRAATVEPEPTEPDLLGLTWSEEEVVAPAAAVDRRWTRKRSGLVVAGVVAAAALTGGGFVGVQYLGDSGLRTALSSSTRDFNAVVAGVSQAKDVEQVATAADAAEPAADRIDGALDRLGRTTGARETAVRRQLEAERTLLLAVSQLQSVASEPLASWGAAHADVSAAVQGEEATRDALATHHASSAAGLADTEAMLAAVTGAVGPALVEDATAESAKLLESLRSARTTGDLRKLGDAAAPEQAAVEAAAQALPAGDGKQVLVGYAAALDALSNLSTLDGERTGSWAGTRAALAQTFGQVASAAGSTGGASVRTVLDGALTSADTVVGKAASAMADWKAKTEAAVQARADDTQALTSYASFFRSQAKTYEQLRQDLSTFTDRVEDPTADVTYYEAYEFLSQAAQDRRDVRDLMVGMDVPAEVRTAHQEMVSAIDRAISAVQSAYDGLEQSQDCFYDDCTYYRDTPGWQRFQSESDAISKAYAGAMTRWEAAATTARSTIANRPLPAKPQV